MNGPAISSSGSALAAAWFTAPGDKPQVKAALSQDGGCFGQPVQIDDGQPIGRVDVVAVASDESLVSWAETSANGTQIRARYVKADGTRSPSIVVAPISGGLSSGFPRMEKTGDEIVFSPKQSAKPLHQDDPSRQVYDDTLTHFAILMKGSSARYSFFLKANAESKRDELCGLVRCEHVVIAHLGEELVARAKGDSSTRIPSAFISALLG